ncbi:MAG: transcription antitermination protein NusB [Microcystis aeruginosa Ma_QC_Ch_20071001_S25]|jgi:N utilization substance protein B|uniref:Transcription antitermination protein NusB n=2 Tax=Microcystis aeruginosa TaxID=1126 RepID=A0A552G629_MICAE|nr:MULTISPECIES: transcription antitermination factor NusB [unclassified Microcystis]MCA2765235.1 transcription antitermination protein NusB [Microcystis sp. M151S2]MCA2928137.1 transcription antitermination protein NusB [Microcystis sp. M020S1]MCA2937094.1 transcription antitermination protein NusB [Microcystis sp. M015S1]MCU7243264.1 transcription antitermination factor NusB [Microcystis aeruginosa WS75]NCQ71354.1 transcription antitermination protein NusB [Microcystis aeruginosa W13-16]NCQ
MSPRQQPRRIARELALLSLSQIKGNPENLEQQTLNDLILVAVRTLTLEIQETLETAAAEISRGNERILASDTKATNLKSAQTMVQEAISLTHNAINRLGTVIDFPEIVQLSSQYEVREYALELIGTVYRRRAEIEQELTGALVDWQLHRLPRIDRDILQIAVAEMLYLDLPQKVAINEAIELAKRYSDDEGYRFINGVLRRVTNKLNESEKAVSTQS